MLTKELTKNLLKLRFYYIRQHKRPRDLLKSKPVLVQHEMPSVTQKYSISPYAILIVGCETCPIRAQELYKVEIWTSLAYV